MDEILVLNKKIKEILKKKSVTYKKLAEELSMSESGVKKLLSGKDHSLSRLMQICQVLNVDINHLFSSLKDKDDHVCILAEKHERFFLENWDYFCFYWVKVIEGWPLKEILTTYDIPLKRAQKYLRKLDALNLLEYHNDNKIKYPDVANIQFKGVNKLERKVMQYWPDELIKYTRKNWDKEEDPAYLMGWSKMSYATYVEFKAELAKTIKNFRNRGHYDNDALKENMTMVKFCFSMNTGSFVKLGDL